MVTAAVIGRQLRVSAYQGEERREVILEPTLISENFLFLRQAILAGLGIGLVPDYVVQEDVRRGEVLTTLDDWRLSIFGTQMFMLYMPNRQHTRATRTFIDFILERARARPDAARRHASPQSREECRLPTGADAALARPSFLPTPPLSPPLPPPPPSPLIAQSSALESRTTLDCVALTGGLQDMKNLKISARLGLGFAVLLLLLLAVTGIGLGQMATCRTRSASPTRSGSASSTSSTGCSSRSGTARSPPATWRWCPIRRSRRRTSNWSSAPRPRSTGHGRLSAIMKEPGAATVEERRMLEELKALEAKYLPIAGKVVSLATSARTEEAIKALSRNACRC